MQEVRVALVLIHQHLQLRLYVYMLLSFVALLHLVTKEHHLIVLLLGEVVDVQQVRSTQIEAHHGAVPRTAQARRIAQVNLRQRTHLLHRQCLNILLRHRCNGVVKVWVIGTIHDVHLLRLLVRCTHIALNAVTGALTLARGTQPPSEVTQSLVVDVVKVERLHPTIGTVRTQHIPRIGVQLARLLGSASIAKLLKEHHKVLRIVWHAWFVFNDHLRHFLIICACVCVYAHTDVFGGEVGQFLNRHRK